MGNDWIENEIFFLQGILIKYDASELKFWGKYKYLPHQRNGIAGRKREESALEDILCILASLCTISFISNSTICVLQYMINK
jgi:hypothetical protein